MCNVSVHSIATSSLQSCTSVLSFDLSQRRNDPLKKFCSPLSENLFLRSPLVERQKIGRAAGEKFSGSSARPKHFTLLQILSLCFGRSPKNFHPGGTLSTAQRPLRSAQRESTVIYASSSSSSAAAAAAAALLFSSLSSSVAAAAEQHYHHHRLPQKNLKPG